MLHPYFAEINDDDDDDDGDDDDGEEEANNDDIVTPQTAVGRHATKKRRSEATFSPAGDVRFFHFANFARLYDDKTTIFGVDDVVVLIDNPSAAAGGGAGIVGAAGHSIYRTAVRRESGQLEHNHNQGVADSVRRLATMRSASAKRQTRE